MSKGQRLLVVGFDGLDFELFKAHSRLDLPVVELFSPVPVTGPAWTSIYTGVGVQAHGIRDVHARARSHQIVRGRPRLDRLAWFVYDICVRLGLKKAPSRDRTTRTTPAAYLWDLLSEAGVSVKLVNMPVTWPARPVNGCYVAGFPLPPGRGRWTWPTDLRKRLPEDYWQMSDIINWFVYLPRDGIGSWREPARRYGLEALLERAEELSCGLVEFAGSLPEADLTMIQFSFIDRIGHAFGVEGAAEEGGYALVDRLIQEAGQRLGEGADLMVVSDHGFQGSDHTNSGVLAHDGFLAGEDSPKRARVYDIAATVLAYFDIRSGVPVQWGGAGPGRSDAEGSEREQAEAAELRERLEQLGYF
ncbi:MAG: alkaline phosphatase family protein [Candidatus Brocadiia bacterium]